jgi:hypothetical protein
MAEAPAFGKDNRAKERRLGRAEREGCCDDAIGHHGPPLRFRHGPTETHYPLHDVGSMCDATSMKGQQKPKQLAKKAPQKTLKEQRAAKKAKKKDY